MSMPRLLSSALPRFAWAVCLLLMPLFSADPADSVRQALRRGALVVDVRTPSEFAGGHYAGAVNLPLDQIHQRFGELGDGKKPVVVYCHSGRRSAMAKSMLLKHGFQDVWDGGGLHQMPPPDPKK